MAVAALVNLYRQLSSLMEVQSGKSQFAKPRTRTYWIRKAIYEPKREDDFPHAMDTINASRAPNRQDSHHSRSSGMTGWDKGITDFLSLSLGSAFLISVAGKKKRKQAQGRRGGGGSFRRSETRLSRFPPAHFFAYYAFFIFLPGAGKKTKKLLKLYYYWKKQSHTRPK